jgi:hypothetical protein
MVGRETVCSGCEGNISELRQRKLGNGSVQIVYQCLRCGRAMSNPLSRSAVKSPNALAQWDEAIALRFERERLSKRENERAEWFREHNAYLRSPEWRARRVAVLARAKGVCEGVRAGCRHPSSSNVPPGAGPA